MRKCQKLQFFEWPLEAGSKVNLHSPPCYNGQLYSRNKQVYSLVKTVLVSIANFPLCYCYCRGVNFYITHHLKLYVSLKFPMFRGRNVGIVFR